MSRRIKGCILAGSSLGLGHLVSSYLGSKSCVSAAKNDENITTTLSTYPEQNLHLVNVQVFFRHGARTPVIHLSGVPEVYYDKRFITGPVPHAEIPYILTNLWDNGPPQLSVFNRADARVEFLGGVHAGMLTKIGKDQAFYLGKRLQEKYIEKLRLIPQTFVEDDILTTNMSRTVDTVEAVLAGMFGKDNITKPVCIYTSDKEREFLYHNSSYCRSLGRITKIAEEFLKSSDIISETNDNIIKIIGDKYDDKDILQWRDHVITRKTQGLPVPSWMDELLPKFEEASVLIFRTTSCGPERYMQLGLSMTAGPMLGMVKEHMDYVIANSPKKKKLCLYSGHDTSLASLLISLGIFDEKCPPYAADLRLELYENNKGRHFVKILYCGQEMIPAGLSDTLLSIDEFFTLIKPYASTFEKHQNNCADVSAFMKYVEDN